MSITARYYVQCNGCGRYLNDIGLEPKRVGRISNATVFPSESAADRAGHLAGWGDGSRGQFAPCTCGAKDDPERINHEPTCRRKRPRRGPVCPPCYREQ